jgi:hypothetical protein
VTDEHTPWTFGVEPLAQARELTPLMRRVASLVQALEHDDPAVAQLVEDLRNAERMLAGRARANATPRIGEHASDDRRPYVQHARDVGAFNPCFPEYEIAVDGARATGTVTFPIVFEGPPGVVHGGVLATFFDCVVQHHNCDVGVAGKTTSLLLEYQRPAPLALPLAFEIDRSTDDRRISSRACLRHDGDTLCTATVEAVAGDRSRLPEVSPRRPMP